MAERIYKYPTSVDAVVEIDLNDPEVQKEIKEVISDPVNELSEIIWNLDHQIITKDKFIDQVKELAKVALDY